MIIDLILNRRDDEQENCFDYTPEQFYRECMEYGNDKITRAMDMGTENDVKHALCDYIDNGEYNQDIKQYINSVAWL